MRCGDLTVLTAAVLLMAACGPDGGSIPANAEPDPGTAVISGLFWLDDCEPSAEDPVPAGCVVGPYGEVIGNGVADPLDPIPCLVWMVLWRGSCPGDEIVSGRASEPDGHYAFTDLPAGDYCLVIDPSLEDNLRVLGPGAWSLPAVYDSGPALVPIILGPGEVLRGVNLSYDPSGPVVRCP